jgi:hypothetical protein
MVTRKTKVQTTVRMAPEKLRELQYYLSLEGVSLAKFVDQQADAYIQHYRQVHPERVPGGIARKKKGGHELVHSRND